VATPPSAPRTNLTAAATPFVGREAELGRIAEMLGDSGCRLLTLVGIGGLGKTRLAVEAARQALSQALDGAYLVPLVDVAHPHLIGTAIAESIGLPLQGNLDPLAQIGRYLGDKRILLVLDNFEHLLDAAEQLLALLGDAPHLKILVTSRQRLRLREEWIVELDGLAAPPPGEAASADYAAIQLFVRSAQRMQSDFLLDDAAGPAVAEICRLVGGLPLGIELAAAWVRTLSCAEIAAEICHSLDILTTTARNVPERQRSLRAVLDSAWAMLGAAEQLALGGLAVFRGGARREAIASVLGTPLPVLAALVDAALTRRTAEGRYLLHELVRQYAGERSRAASADDDQRRHAGYYHELVRVAAQGLKATDQGRWLAEIQAEEDNIRAALDWALGGDPELGLRLCGDMWTFWLMRGHMAEARHWIDRALDLAGPAVPGEVHARVLYAAGDAARLRGEYAQARDLASRALALYESGDHDEGMVAALVCLGNIAYNQGESERAFEHYSESLGLLRQLDLPLRTAHVLSNLGLICQDRGDYAQAQALYRESLDVQRRLGYDRGVSNTLSNLGWLAVVLGSYAEARALLEESLAIRAGLDDRRGVAISLTNLGELELLGGDLSAAASLTDRALAIFRELDDRRGVASGLAQAAAVALELDDLERAFRDYRESLALGYALRLRPIIVGALDGLGRCLVRAGDLAAAARLLAAAERWRAEFAVLPIAAEGRRTAAALDVIRATLDG
ncbi:MAG TPA: tetratricopeptide repeat protein, partial [Herpetosiphonaceae bacterium]|nr:tetratricopeptide repeat protein [Herpetosiphonaceae bacterium]